MRGSRLLGVPGHGIDGESLQADVMRFMAIIAFCLIAILALVRNVEPGADPTTVAAAAPPTAERVPSADLQPVSPAPVARPSQERLVRVAPPPAPEPRPEPMADATATAAISMPPPAVAVAEPPAELEPDVAAGPPEAVPEAPEAAPAKPAAEPGLSLRFASDRDFMRLVTKGDIQVYAFREGQHVLGLARNFEFAPAPAPGRLYELMPDTIPKGVLAALGRATADAARYAWGIRLPPRLEGRIREYVEDAVVGQLVIDRYGQVHHRAS